MQQYISTLDTNQKKAVLHNKGPILVLAGAGSGKTRVLTFRIARLIKEKHCQPQNILAVTFTNKAAREMQERIAKLTSKKIAQAMTVSTFHSFGVRVLREHGSHIGLKSHFSILNENERISTIKSIMRSYSTAMQKENPNNYSSQISLAKNGSLSPKEFGEIYPEERKTQRIYASYCSITKKRQCVDFDDLLLLPLKIFKTKPEILEIYRKRYSFISIDEFQDTNTVQMQLCTLLSAPKNNLMVVGDDDQGIYSWRGAEIENILSFSTRHKKCKTVILDKNYRSTPEIVLGASGVIEHNEKRKPKNIKAAANAGTPIQTFNADDELEEVQWIINTIIENNNRRVYSYREHAMLFRTNAQMARFEEELRIQRIPYVVQGAMSFFDRKEVKDVLAYLRFFANTHDEISLMRLLKVPNRGITRTTFDELESLAGKRRMPLWKAFEQFNAIVNLHTGQKEKLASLVDFYSRHAKGFKKGALSDTLQKLLNECHYSDLLKNAYKNDKSLQIRLENINEIIHTLELYEKRCGKKTPSLNRYLQEFSLLANDKPDEDKNRKGVILMTLHKSKGLEFPVVFLPLLDDTIFPSPRSCSEGMIEEERRLFYVGMTRAKELLYLTCPRTKIYRKKTLDVKPCRFIYEIPEEYVDGKFGEREDKEAQKDNADFFAQMKKRFSS